MIWIVKGSRYAQEYHDKRRCFIIIFVIQYSHNMYSMRCDDIIIEW